MIRAISAMASIGILLSACGGGSDTTSSGRDVPNNIKISNVSVRDGNDRRIVMQNESGGVVIGIFYRPSGLRSWGEDIFRLGWLQDGNSVVVNMENGSGVCTYDFLVQRHPAGEIIYYDQNVCEDRANLTIR